MKNEINIDLRQQMNALEVKVKKEFGFKLSVKNKVLVYLGIEFIKLGCWFCGASFKEEA